MTDYTDLKARLCVELSAVLGPKGADYSAEPVTFYMEALAAITALEADIARLQTAHVQMQRAMTDLAAENARLRGAVLPVMASLAAAISLLERGGKLAKKAAASDKMFDQMLTDYRKSLAVARAALTTSG